MQIYCLFSMLNDYNQPPNNLVGWWVEKPSIETIAKALNLKFPSTIDEETLAIVKIWGEEQVTLHDTDYFLRLVNEGIL